MKYNVILLHHEQTKGMKSFGSKALLKIKLQNKTDSIIYHQLETFTKNLDKESQIIVVVGFDKERLIKKIHLLDDNKKITIVYNKEYDILNTAYAMMLGLEKIENNYPTLIVDSGVLLQHKLDTNEELMTQNNVVFINKNNQEFDIGCTLNDSKVEYMFYDLSPKWINVLSVSPIYRDRIKTISNIHKNSNIFEIINYSLKDCQTKFSIIDTKVYHIKNQKHRLVKVK